MHEYTPETRPKLSRALTEPVSHDPLHETIDKGVDVMLIHGLIDTKYENDDVVICVLRLCEGCSSWRRRSL